MKIDVDKVLKEVLASANQDELQQAIETCQQMLADQYKKQHHRERVIELKRGQGKSSLAIIMALESLREKDRVMLVAADERKLDWLRNRIICIFKLIGGQCIFGKREIMVNNKHRLKLRTVQDVNSPGQCLDCVIFDDCDQELRRSEERELFFGLNKDSEVIRIRNKS